MKKMEKRGQMNEERKKEKREYGGQKGKEREARNEDKE